MKQVLNFEDEQAINGLTPIDPAQLNQLPLSENQIPLDELEQNLQAEMEQSPQMAQLQQEAPIATTDALSPIQQLQEKFRKYQDMKNLQPMDEAGLQDAINQRNRNQGLALVLKGAQQTAQGMANRYAPNFKADTGVADTLYKQAEQPISDELLKRKTKNEQSQFNDVMMQASMKLEGLNLDLTNMEQNSDPNSEISKLAQETASLFNPKLNPDSLKEISAAQLFKMFPQFQQLTANEIRRQQTGQNSLAMQLKARQLELNEKSYDLRKEQGGKRLDLAEDKLGWQKDEKDELSDKQTEGMATVDSTLLDLNDAKKFKVDVNTGRVEAGSDYVRKLLGNQEPTMVNLKQALGNALADRKREITGTAASDSEAKFIESITVPDISMNDELFMSTLDNATRRVERYRQLKLDGFKKQGKNSEAFEKPFGSEEKSTDPKVDEYAKSHNLTYDKAMSILKARGYNGK